MVCLHLPVFLLTVKIAQNAWSPRTKHLAYQISTKRVRCLQVKPIWSKLHSVYRSTHSAEFCINKLLRTMKRLYFCLKMFSMFFIFADIDIVEFFFLRIAWFWLAHSLKVILLYFIEITKKRQQKKNKQIKTLRERILNFINLKLWLTIIPRERDTRWCIDSCINFNQDCRFRRK